MLACLFYVAVGWYGLFYESWSIGVMWNFFSIETVMDYMLHVYLILVIDMTLTKILYKYFGNSLRIL